MWHLWNCWNKFHHWISNSILPWISQVNWSPLCRKKQWPGPHKAHQRAHVTSLLTCQPRWKDLRSIVSVTNMNQMANQVMENHPWNHRDTLGKPLDLSLPLPEHTGMWKPVNVLANIPFLPVLCSKTLDPTMLASKDKWLKIFHSSLVVVPLSNTLDPFDWLVSTNFLTRNSSGPRAIPLSSSADVVQPASTWSPHQAQLDNGGNQLTDSGWDHLIS